MSKQNGGIIGPDNVPTGAFGAASGVWKLSDVTNYKRQGTWPVPLTGHQVANSVRLNDGSSDGFSLSGQNGNRKTFTFSCWVKRGVFGENFLFNSRIDASNHFLIRFTGSHQLELLNRTSASNNFILTTNRLFRDVSAWYNIVVAVDTTQSTANDRVKFYVNNVQESSFATQTMGSQNADLSLNISTATHYIGQEYTSGYNFFDGYLAETVLTDGSQLAPTSFGETDSVTNNWVPKDVSGLTFGTNGFYLDFKDSSALGNDVSGNNNDYTANNLTSIDQSVDTCTNNFATLNLLENFYNQSTFSEGNLQVAVGSSQYSYNLSTIGVSSGKWYCEMKCTSVGGATTDIAFGISSTQPISSSQVLGYHPNDVAYRGNGNKKINNSDTSYGDTFSTNDIIGIALNLDDNEVKFYKNGTVQNSGTAISITAPASTGLGNYFFGVSYIDTSNTATFQTNFGSPMYAISSGNVDSSGMGNFEYAVPSGYYSICTRNLNLIG